MADENAVDAVVEGNTEGEEPGEEQTPEALAALAEMKPPEGETPPEVKADPLQAERDRLAEMRRGAHKAFEEAAKARKEAQQIREEAQRALGQLRRDPATALKIAGMTEEEQERYAAWVLEQAMLRQGVDPRTGQPLSQEARDRMLLENRLAQAEGERQQLRERQEAAERQQALAEVRERMDAELTEALASTSLPKTPYTIMRLAELVDSHDYQVPAKELAGKVQAQLQQEMAYVASTTPIAELVKMLPREFFDALRKYDLEQARGGKGVVLQGSGPKVLEANKGITEKRRHQRVTDPKKAQEDLDAWASGGGR